MRYININKVKPGEKLGKDLVDENCRMLLKSDTVLTERIIQLLSDKEIQYVYIDDELSKGVEIEEVIPQYLRNSTVQDLKKMNVEKTIVNAKGIVDNILSMQNLSVDVYSDSKDDNSLYEHSLAVTQFAVLFGNSLGLNQSELNQLAVSSLLHDVGKMCGTNPENISKYDVKSVFESFGIELPATYDDKYHPLYGYAILKDNVVLDSVIRNSILRHHENYDNTGIKYSKNSSNDVGTATQFAKIINISDTFVRLMTNTYSEAKIASITEAVEFMSAYSGTKFDKAYVEKFLTSVPIFPKGLTVDLSNGMQAVIAEVRKEMPTRPKVIINGKLVDLADPRLLNLVITNISGTNYEQVKHL